MTCFTVTQGIGLKAARLQSRMTQGNYQSFNGPLLEPNFSLRVARFMVCLPGLLVFHTKIGVLTPTE
jgi:hypothetical protein